MNEICMWKTKNQEKIEKQQAVSLNDNAEILDRESVNSRIAIPQRISQLKSWHQFLFNY